MKKEYKTVEERLENIENLLLGQKSVFSLNDASVYAGLSKSHLYKLTSSGEIPFYKPQGKCIYFNKEELEAWLLRNRNATNEELQEKAQAYCMAKKK